MSRREDRWRKYYACENEHKRSYLRKMTEKDSVNIIRELYQYARVLNGDTGCTVLDKRRIDNLARVHAVFNKVTNERT
jgi:hypothetical protein